MSNEPIDYFKAAPADYPVLLSESEYRNRVDRTLEVFVDEESRPLTIDDAAAAIAAVIHLWRKPDEDLHGYTQYVDKARSFLTGVWQLEKVAEVVADLTDAGIPQMVADDARASIEAARGRTLEEILGQ